MGVEMGSGSNDPSPPVLSVRLLGGFAVHSAGKPVAVDSARTQALLAYLILHQGADQPRERLAYLFWPDSGESQARTNMRQALHRLKNTLPDADRFLKVEQEHRRLALRCIVTSRRRRVRRTGGLRRPGLAGTRKRDLLRRPLSRVLRRLDRAVSRAASRVDFWSTAERLAEAMERIGTTAAPSRLLERWPRAIP